MSNLKASVASSFFLSITFAYADVVNDLKRKASEQITLK